MSTCFSTCFYAYLVVVATVHARSLSPHWRKDSVKEFDEYPSTKLINNRERLNMQFDVQNGSECVQYCRSTHDCHAINVIKEHNGTSSCEFFASSEGRSKHSSRNRHGKRTHIQSIRPSRSDIYTKESKTYDYMKKDYNDFYIGRRHIFIPRITSHKTPTSFQKRRLLIRHVASSLRGHKRHFLPSSDKDDDDDDDDANKEQEEVPIDGNCKFPFIYDGVTRYHCQEGLNDPTQRWCSLTSNFDRDTKWKRCTPASHPKRKTLKIPEVDSGVDDDKPADSKRSKKVKYTLIQSKWKKRWKGLVCMLKGNNSCATTNTSFTLNDTKITHDNATDRDGVVGASSNTTSDSSTAAPPTAPVTEANVTANLVRSYDRIFKDEDLLKESNMTVAVENTTSKRRKCVFKELCPKFYDDVSSESDGEVESTKNPVENNDKKIAKISKSSKDLLNTTIDGLLASLSTNNDSISVPEDVHSDSSAAHEVHKNDSSAVPEVQHIPNVPNIKFAENTTVSELPHEIDGDESNMGNFLNDMKSNAAKMEKEEEKNIETTLADEKPKGVGNETVSEHTEKNEESSSKEDEKTKAVSNETMSEHIDKNEEASSKEDEKTEAVSNETTVSENVDKNEETAQTDGEKTKAVSNETVSEKADNSEETSSKDDEKIKKISNETLSESADNNEETAPKDDGTSKPVENDTVSENADKNNLTSEASEAQQAASDVESNPNTSQSTNSVPGAKNINIIIINNRNDSLDLDEIEKTISQSTSSPFKQNETEDRNLINEGNNSESKPKTYALHSDESTSIMPEILAKHDVNNENIVKINLTKEVKTNVSLPEEHIDKEFHRIPNTKNSMKAMKEKLGIGQSGIVEPPKPLTTLEIETKFNESRQYLSGDATNSALTTKPSHVSSSTLLFDTDINTNGIEKKDNGVTLPSLRKSGLVNMNYAPEEIEITTYGGNADKGEKCKFPFIYDGDTYFNCINLNRDKPWCSVTENYDRSPRWGYCSEEELAMGEEEQKLKNSNHNSNNDNNNNNHSNNKNNNNRKVKKQEARVLSSAEEELISEHNGVNTFGGNANGAPCTIPFVYDGRTHMKCIEKQDGTSWCATQRNYDIRPTWGYCCDDEKC